MAAVTVIPASVVKTDVLRVAAYCRVSSDSADQLHSYAAQIRNYTEVIEKHDGWKLIDVYADEGLTGTRMDNRDDFNRMIADCRKGKIDKILVKSISRFSRNTYDCLSVLRELTALGVSVYFEKENIGTETLTTEMMVSVYSALAQEESVSISQNQRISYQRRMERGEFITCYAPLGYRIVDGKNLEIVPEEAELVRWMFNSYLSGHSTEWISRELKAKGVPTASGRGGWQPQTIQKLLCNEKYIGDTLCRKTYTMNAFPFVRKRNDGTAEQYYIENTHPAIISRDDFARVQRLMELRAYRLKSTQGTYPLTKKIICGHCGATFVRKKSRKGFVTWSCLKHIRNASDCEVGRIPENGIYAAFVTLYNKLKENTDTILQPAIFHLSGLNDILQKGNPEILAINRAIAEATEKSYKVTKVRTAGLIDEEICVRQLREINTRITQLRRERRMVLKNQDIEDLLEALIRTMRTVEAGPDRLEEFDEELFAGLVENITAVSETCLRFRLYGGLALTEQLREGMT